MKAKTEKQISSIRCSHLYLEWPYNQAWKVIKCDDETDVCECRLCGAIKTFPCNFDEEYS